MRSIFVVAVLLVCLENYHKANAQTEDLSASQNTGTSSLEFITRISRRKVNSRRNKQNENSDSMNRENIQNIHPKLQILSRYPKLRVVNIALHTQYFIKSVTCENFMTTNDICLKIKATPLEDMIFYYAKAKPNTMYTVTFADGSLKDPVAQNAVAVVDPFPLSSFGHFVFVFYVYNMTNITCRNHHGLHREPNICLTLATRRSCRRFSNNATELEIFKKCEINFIPLVYDGHRDNIDKKQRLECVERASGYADCPKVLASNDDVISIPNTSTLQEQQSQRSPEYGRREVCREFGLCDYAVGIFGGWDNLTSQRIQIQHQDNALTMFEMLKKNGFTNDKIQFFFHNEFPNELQQLHSYEHGLPASNKQLVRGHIKSLCGSSNCVDSMVIYLNGPTTTDGSLLLWDNNGDGRAAKNEEYRVNELLKDITGCNARRLILLADQSYAGILTASLRKKAGESRAWSHVILLTSTGTREYSWNKEATNLWGKLDPVNAISELFPDGDQRHQSTFTITNRREAEAATIYGANIGEVKSLTRRTRSRLVPDHLLQCQPITAEYFGFPSK